MFGFGKVKIKKSKTIVIGVNLSRETPGARLIDLRPSYDFKDGHIKGSINLSPDRKDLIKSRIREMDVPLFLYGNAGTKLKKDAKEFRDLGYTDITVIGYIEDYRGQLQRGKV
ncbi:MAG: rhodanese-like domain-containing protein [Chordicoccus sp.]